MKIMEGCPQAKITMQAGRRKIITEILEQSLSILVHPLITDQAHSLEAVAY